MKHLRFILLMLPFFVNGQSRINGWKSHVSFSAVVQVAETPEGLVAACSGGLFYTGRDGSSVRTHTKVEGLSDTGITALAYSASSHTLLVGYRSGNLDLLLNGRVFTIPDIARRTDFPEKTINRIVCEGNSAFLCCAFGIVQINLSKKEVAETWFPSTSGQPAATFDLASYNGSWWAATATGILRAAQQGSNLQDYRSWQIETASPLSETSFSSLVPLDGLLYSHDLANDRMLAYNGTSWEQKYPEIKNIRGIRPGNHNLIVLADASVWLAAESGNTRIDSYSATDIARMDPRDALVDRNGDLWIGDNRYGLTRKSGISFQHIVPNSPAGDRISALKLSPEGIFVANESGATNGKSGITYSIWDSGVWQNFSENDDIGLKSKSSITSFAFDKDKPGEYWASTAGSGLLYFQKNRMKASFDASNSALGSRNETCVINGIDLDANGHLWYTNPTGNARTGYRSSSGIFTPLPYPGMNLSGLPTGEIITDSRGIHWVVLPDEGLFAFRMNGTSENLSDDLYRKIQVRSLFKNATTSRITTFNEISAVAEDRNHTLWVGTGSGVVLYTNPETVFDNGDFYGYQPSIENDESLFQPILDKERITCISVDGANRKWIGTAGSGVYLFSENGTRMLHHFDIHNSPLPSDEILSLAILPENGEVFMATSEGLVSYKSDATEASASLDKMYVWPNPLRESFDGEVTIDGLTEGTDVRITDINGTLMYHTTSAGGRAVWSARKANGQKVSTGVYLIFCSHPGSGNSKIIKLLVIH